MSGFVKICDEDVSVAWTRKPSPGMTYDIRVLADVITVFSWSVAVESSDFDIFETVDRRYELPERALLILGKSLCREHVQCGRFRVVLESFDDGQLVDEGFAGRGRRRNDDIAAERMLCRRM